MPLFCASIGLLIQQRSHGLNHYVSPVSSCVKNVSHIHTQHTQLYWVMKSNLASETTPSWRTIVRYLYMPCSYPYVSGFAQKPFSAIIVAMKHFAKSMKVYWSSYISSSRMLPVHGWNVCEPLQTEITMLIIFRLNPSVPCIHNPVWSYPLHLRHSQEIFNQSFLLTILPYIHYQSGPIQFCLLYICFVGCMICRQCVIYHDILRGHICFTYIYDL